MRGKAEYKSVMNSRGTTLKGTMNNPLIKFGKKILRSQSYNFYDTPRMSNAIGPSRKSNPSRKICNLRAVPLGHIVDNVQLRPTHVPVAYFGMVAQKISTLLFRDVIG